MLVVSRTILNTLVGGALWRVCFTLLLLLNYLEVGLLLQCIHVGGGGLLRNSDWHILGLDLTSLIVKRSWVLLRLLHVCLIRILVDIC